jgi:copper chaperone CopZ
MKTLSRFSLASIVAVLMACSGSQPSEEISSEVEITKVVRKGEIGKAIARIGIKGMSCEMACGGAIKKCLKNIEGITTTDIEFDHSNETNLAEVTFDEKTVSEKEMIAAIEKLHDGQYKVKSVELVISETSYEKIEEDEEEDGKPLEVSALPNAPRIVIPTIFSAISALVEL